MIPSPLYEIYYEILKNGSHIEELERLPNGDIRVLVWMPYGPVEKFMAITGASIKDCHEQTRSFKFTLTTEL